MIWRRHLSRRQATGRAIAVHWVFLFVVGACGNLPPDPGAQLRKAAFTGDIAGVIKALAAGAEVDSRGPDGKTPLMGACYFAFGPADGHVAVIEHLLQAGANANAFDHSGNTPLIAAVVNYPTAVQSLLHAGADANQQGATGWTALIYAAKAGNLGLLRELLDAGGRTDVRNQDGETAVDVARRFNKEDAVGLLKAADRGIGSGAAEKYLPWKGFSDPFYAFTLEYPPSWEPVVNEAHRFAAKQGEDFFIAAEATVVAPISDKDRKNATRTVFNKTTEEMGIKGAKPVQVAAGVADALKAAETMEDGKWAWVEVTSHGDVRYRIRVVTPKGPKEQNEPTAERILTSFKVSDEVRISGSPFSHDTVALSAPDNPVPNGWRLQENPYGFRFAYPQEWALKAQSRGRGYDYSDGSVEFYCGSGANYIQEPSGIPLRGTKHTILLHESPEGASLVGEPTIRDAGIVKSIVAHYILKSADQYWILVAVKDDVWYELTFRCRSQCETKASVAKDLVESFQVTLTR